MVVQELPNLFAWVRFDDGYTLGNVVLCTYRANSIKRDVSLDELREWMPGWYDRLVSAGKVVDKADPV